MLEKIRISLKKNEISNTLNFKTPQEAASEAHEATYENP
jgi:hypothetical protein